MRRPVRLIAAALACIAVALLRTDGVTACTAFCAVGGGKVLVGNNEDWNNPRTKIHFIPARDGSYGRLYVGFDDMSPQGGMNERGLWFDGFAVAPTTASASSELPSFPGNIVDEAMAKCAMVEDVIRLFGQYNRSFLSEGILMFADATGDAVSIEANAMVRKTRRHFVQTNFRQSHPPREHDDRFATATTMLDEAGDKVSPELARRILAATYQKGGYPTLYSNVYDLKARTMSLYYFHDFEHAVTFDLAEELKKGERTLDIPALFSSNPAAETFAGGRQPRRGPSPAVTATAALGVVAIAVLIALVADIRGGRRARLGVSAGVGTLALLVIAGVLAFRAHPEHDPRWLEFSIGPASGESVSIQPAMIRGNGVTLRGALATAYDIPAIRVIGPSWLTESRYTLNAVVGVEDVDSFRPLLQEELKKQLRLETHVEVRPFDAFVLTATRSPRLERSPRTGPSITVSKREVRFQAASMADLASILQSIIGKPVVDETGITGVYDMDLAWPEPGVASLTAVLRDQFGLQLSPAKRNLDVLVVDTVHRDAALMLLAEAGRATRGTPRAFREQVARLLTLR